MTDERPQYYPRHDANGTNSIDVQDNPFILNGFPVGYIIPSNIHNGLWRWISRWIEHLDCLGIRNGDWIDTVGTYRLSLTDLTYGVGGNVLSDLIPVTVATQGVYLLESRRIETNDALLNPIGSTTQGSPLVVPTAITPGRIWVYASRSGQSRVSSVAPGTLDAANADEMTLVGVDVDGAGVVTDGSVAPVNTPLPTARSMTVDIPTLIETLTALVLSAERIIGTGNSSSLPTIEGQASANAPTVLVTGNGSTTAAQAAVDVDGNSGRSLRATSTGTVAAVDVIHTGSGAGVRVTGTTVGIFTEATTGLAVEAETTSGTAIQALSLGSGDAIVGAGGPSAISSGGVFVSGHTGAVALSAQTIGAALSSASAVRGRSFGDATALEALASDGYGVVAESDTTSPTRAAARLVPQDNDPSTPLQGDLHFGSNRGPTGKLRTYTAQHESLHSSDKGHVEAWGTNESGVSASTGDISTAQITPEEVGDVLVVATGHLGFNSDTQEVTVTLRDTTVPATIGAQLERAPDIDGGSNRERSFVIRVRYTLPTTATRDFAVQLSTNAGTVAYEHVITTVRGVL